MATDSLTLTDRRSARALAFFFVFAGVMHFVRPKTYEAIMPPWIPAHREMVLASGVAEIAGGVAALSPRSYGFARWWLIGLLLAVFPANIHMTLNPEDIKGLPDIPSWLLWARLPLQGAAIWWVVRATAQE